ncbi:MAG: hypothetical protein JWM02_3006 [Frankiales bacterium]|nr:hypothetical protein [Frankiales bacterium]
MLTDAQVRKGIAAAIKAPSLHNTQPWLFTPTGDSVLVRADVSRWLRHEDPLGRELMLSCGGAVRHLVLGLRVQGLEVRCDLLPHPTSDPEQVAVVTVVGRRPPTRRDLQLHAAAWERHTDRSAFENRPVPSDVLDQLRGMAETDGAFLDVLSADDVLELAVLTERAEALLQCEPVLRTEQARWVSTGDQPPEGLPGHALPEHGAHRGSPVRLRDFLAAPTGPAADPDRDPPVVEHPVLVVLGTRDDDRSAWLTAGWAVSGVLLTLTSLGLVASPLTQALEVAGLRSRMRTSLRLQGSPQMVLRLGYPRGPGSPQAGRRALDDVLCRS